jgi:tryptophan 2,3-dioxygenase
MTNKRSKLLEQLDTKLESIGQRTDVHLEGLLYGKPITYWDYIQTDALLNLQIQRSNQPDEMVFIMYHQVNELLFKMILWELAQIAANDKLEADFFTCRLGRISRYFDVLTSSFDVMKNGMEVEQYMKFRNTLTPASGFQSAQYRKIEFASTELKNLIDIRFRSQIGQDTAIADAYKYLYWQAAGLDHKSGKKSTLITLFEERYYDEFIRFIAQYEKKNLWTRFKELPEDIQSDVTLRNAMRHYDYTVNIKWVMAHYNAAKKYLNSGVEKAEATGGSDWQKYMHPRYQKRIFFPSLWSEEELAGWGIKNLENIAILKEQ